MPLSYCLRAIAVILFSLYLHACASVSKKSFSPPSDTGVVDYGALRNWAAHPDKSDMADLIPDTEALAIQSNLDADVFFIHPTTFTGKKGDNQWNAAIDDLKLNDRTDKSTIQFQASIFNKAGRIFAPRYRQAHIYSFYTSDKTTGDRALAFAYEDVKKAFLFYLENENKGRPIIIASHSQGTYHAKRLIKEYFDNKPLSDLLIVAYLVGISVEEDYFEKIEPCQDASQTGCFCSWRTFRTNYYPQNQPVGDSIVVTNPLTWEITDDYAPKEKNDGAVLRNFNKVFDNLVDARIHQGMLWVSRPKFPWSFLFTRKNYHIADFNFFYFNVQQNAVERVESFTGQ